MTAQQWLTLIISVASISGVFVAIVRWMVRHYFNEIRAELKPNGGSSMRDQINRLEERQIRIEQEHGKLEHKIDKLLDTLIEHIHKSQ
jgi:ribosome recycling factor